MENLFKSLLLCPVLCLMHTGLSYGQSLRIVYHENLFPEGLALNSRTGTLLLSSISQRKIIEVNPDGQVVDFITSGEYGFEFGLGMQVDSVNNSLWAVSSDKNSKEASVFVFDLDTHHLVKKYTYQTNHEVFFNDLCLDSQGNVYISDSRNADIYRISKKADSITLFIKNSRIHHPNGITFDPESQSLFVAGDSLGIAKINLYTKHIQLLGTPNESPSPGYDGIYYYPYFLIGIYNGSSNEKDHAIVKHHLDLTKTKIIQIDTLVKGGLSTPTTGWAGKDAFHFLSKTYLLNFISDPSFNTYSNEIMHINPFTMKNDTQNIRRQIIQAMIYEFNEGNWDKLLSYYSDLAVHIDIENGEVKTQLSSKQEVKEKYKAFRGRFPYIHDSLISISFDGDEAEVTMEIVARNPSTSEGFTNKATMYLVFNNENLIIKDTTVY